MSDQRDLLRFTKGARSVLADLRIVLDDRAILCPECHDDPGEVPCLRCANVGFIIPAVAAIGDTK